VERYRYRTKALLGPWRATREEAVADAQRAGQTADPVDSRLDSCRIERDWSASAAARSR
jgi:hypothetical protein